MANWPRRIKTTQQQVSPILSAGFFWAGFFFSAGSLARQVAPSERHSLGVEPPHGSARFVSRNREENTPPSVRHHHATAPTTATAPPHPPPPLRLRRPEQSAAEPEGALIVS